MNPLYRGFGVHPTDELSHFHIGGECLCVVRMPTREGRAVLDDVTGGPKNASLIEGPGRIVVRTKYVKVPDRQPLYDAWDRAVAEG